MTNTSAHTALFMQCLRNINIEAATGSALTHGHALTARLGKLLAYPPHQGPTDLIQDIRQNQQAFLIACQEGPERASLQSLAYLTGEILLTYTTPPGWANEDLCA